MAVSPFPGESPMYRQTTIITLYPTATYPTATQPLDVRSNSMENILSTFAVVQPNNLVSASDAQRQNLVPNVTNTFDEFSKEEIIVEIARLRRYLKAAEISEDLSKKWSSMKFLEFIVDLDICDSVPSLALRFLLTICVSVASCE